LPEDAHIHGLQAQYVGHEVCNGILFLQSLLLFVFPKRVTLSLRRRAVMHPDVHKLQQLIMSYNFLSALDVPVLISFLEPPIGKLAVFPRFKPWPSACEVDCLRDGRTYLGLAL
jgi:hypothetical protein